MEEVNDLVQKLMPDCSIPHLNFGADGIKKHILDTLNERRRCIRKGHDYENVRIKAFVHVQLQWLWNYPSCIQSVNT